MHDRDAERRGPGRSLCRSTSGRSIDVAHHRASRAVDLERAVARSRRASVTRRARRLAAERDPDSARRPTSAAGRPGTSCPAARCVVQVERRASGRSRPATPSPAAMLFGLPNASGYSSPSTRAARHRRVLVRLRRLARSSRDVNVSVRDSRPTTPTSTRTAARFAACGRCALRRVAVDARRSPRRPRRRLRSSSSSSPLVVVFLVVVALRRPSSSSPSASASSSSARPRAVALRRAFFGFSVVFVGLRRFFVAPARSRRPSTAELLDAACPASAVLNFSDLRARELDLEAAAPSCRSRTAERAGACACPSSTSVAADDRVGLELVRELLETPSRTGSRRGRACRSCG